MALSNTEILKIIKKGDFPSAKVSEDIVELISKQLNYPVKIVRKGIVEGQLTINSKKVSTIDIKILCSDKVKFQGKDIKLPSAKQESKFDQTISFILENYFDFHHIDQLYPDQSNFLIAIVLEYLREEYNVSDLKASNYNEQVFRLMEEYYKRNFYKLEKGKIPKRKELVKELLSIRGEAQFKFIEIISKIEKDLYYLDTNEVYQDLGRLFNSKAYKYLIKQLLPSHIDLIDIVKKLINNYKKIINEETQDKKIENNILLQEFIKVIEQDIQEIDIYPIGERLIELINFFKKKGKDAIGFKDTGKIKLEIIPDNRTYNFNQESFDIHMTIKNAGSGIAKEICIEKKEGSGYVINHQMLVELLAPNDSRNVKFNLNTSEGDFTKDDISNLKLRFSYKNDFNQDFEILIDNFPITKQKDDLPWEELNMRKPYSTRAIEDPKKLFGREKLIENLKWNIENNDSITSFIIYGQKRVGKSSIVRTLNTIYQENREIIFIYKSMGDIKNIDPLKTLQAMGETIFKTLIQEFKRRNPQLSKILMSQSTPSFYGSLSPLNDFIEELISCN